MGFDTPLRAVLAAPRGGREPAAPPRDPERFARRVRDRFAFGMAVAHVLGALDCFVLLAWVLPLPPVPDGWHPVLIGAISFPLYMAISIPLSTRRSRRALGPIEEWLRPGRVLGAEDRARILRMPLRQTMIDAQAWAGAIVVFVAISATGSWDVARYVGVTIAMGGVTTCAVGYLLAERLLRPVTALALDGEGLRRPVAPGVAGRLVLSWVTATGVPLAAVGLVGIDGLDHPSISRQRIAVSAIVLAVIAIASGLTATIVVARSIADPLSAVRDALARVEAGDLDAQVRVDDGSEVGLLQNGFNRMAAGLRERERLRDLFGRHVGEDVARAALEGDGELGGHERDVAVLFVDLVGSTALAAQRPPAEVVALLNRFFAVVVEVTAAHDGWVNKFEGDAALCVFGAPAAHPCAAASALRAAREVHERLSRELPEVDAGVGVSAGAAVAGNVGAERRFEYTVIGDPVNEAARLSDLAKTAAARVLASERAVAAAGEEGRRWSTVDEVVLRGRSSPTRVAQPAAPVRAQST